MLNLRRTSGSANAQNVLFVQKYPVTLEKSLTTLSLPWPWVPGAQCQPVLPPITRKDLQTFCTGPIYAAAVALPRSPQAQEPDTAISRLASVPLEMGVYPNPANEQLTVRIATAGATARVRLVDALGRVVYATRVGAEAAAELQETTVPLATLPAGLYQCVVESAGRRQARQVSVLH